MLAAGQLLGGRYEILAPIGAGGMGEVYRAIDRTLAREVAVKILPDSLRFDGNALLRFEKEGRALAALSHPNILAIHDFGSDHGMHYSVTELLHGENLREVLKRSAIPWKKAVEIVIPVSDGLVAAHAAGIIHRDLKPENIFLTFDHRVKILDFGLARHETNISSEELTSAQTVSRQTAPNVVMGTVPYMSPEQVKGEAVDKRTDIFSFGCLLNEMIAGHRTFNGNASAEIIAAILKDDPAPLTDVPPELQKIITHCLEKNQNDRFQSANDLAFALKTVLTNSAVSRTSVQMQRIRSRTAILILAILVIAIGGMLLERKFLPRRPLEKSIAVLPFANLSGDKAEEYFSDGMTEDVITQLSKVGELKVISRTSVMPYKNSNKSLRQIAKELGVAVVLEGSVRRAGNRLRIVGQLIDASTDEHIWADTYDREIKDVFEIQSDVAQNIADALRAKLSPMEKQRIEKRPAENLEAYDLYLRARERSLTAAHMEEMNQAIDLFKKAIALDPKFALAYAALADAYSFSATSEINGPGSNLDLAIQNSKKAISLDPNLAEGYAALGYAYFHKGWNEKGTELAKKALELNPNSARAAAALARNYWITGRLDEALLIAKKYQQLDPANPNASRYVADVYRWLGNEQQARKWINHCVTQDPRNKSCYVTLMLIAAYYGHSPELQPLEEKLLSIAPDEPLTFGVISESEAVIGNYERAAKYDQKLPKDWKSSLSIYLLRRQGKIAEAERVPSDNEALFGKGQGTGNIELAGLYAIRGDKTDAYNELHRAVDRGLTDWRLLEKYPPYESLRNDREFQDIVANVKGRVEEMRRRVAEQNL